VNTHTIVWIRHKQPCVAPASRTGSDPGVSRHAALEEEVGLAEPTAPFDLDKAEVERETRRTSRLQPLPPLNEILPEHIAYVRSVVARFTVRPAYWREDLVQEVLLEAYRSRASRLDVRPLLFGISRHVVSRWTSRMVAQHEAAVDFSSGAVRGMDDDRMAAERRAAVLTSLSELPDIFREVFVRADLDEMVMPDVVEELGIPLSTGYTRLHLARIRFIEAFQRYLARWRITKDDL
jgi:RNA polymerase sigma-70 factor (ECF subfamily)